VPKAAPLPNCKEVAAQIQNGPKNRTQPNPPFSSAAPRPTRAVLRLSPKACRPKATSSKRPLAAGPFRAINRPASIDATQPYVAGAKGALCSSPRTADLVNRCAFRKLPQAIAARVEASLFFHRDRFHPGVFAIADEMIE